MGKANIGRGYEKFREKNPLTNKDYEFGDPHPTKEGVIFKSYRVDKPIKKNGFYQISWTKKLKKRDDGVHRINPKTGKKFLLGDIEIRDGKEMYFKGYETNQVYSSGDRKGCYYETFWTKEIWDNKKSDVKKKQEMINEGFVPKKPLNPKTNELYKRGDTRINPKTKEKEWFMRYATGWAIESGERYISWKSKEKYIHDRIRGINKGCRARAKGKNLKYNLDIEYLESIFPKNMICPVFGTQMEFHTGEIHTSPSVDRINPEKGYTKGNVVWVSYRANSIKQDATPDEILKVGNFYKKLTK